MPKQQKHNEIDALFDKGLAAPVHVSTMPLSVVNGRTGKSSNPDYKKYTVVLKKLTQKTAMRLADDLEPRRDLSDVVEELLARWIEQHKETAS